MLFSVFGPLHDLLEYFEALLNGTADTATLDSSPIIVFLTSYPERFKSVFSSVLSIFFTFILDIFNHLFSSLYDLIVGTFFDFFSNSYRSFVSNGHLFVDNFFSNFDFNIYSRNSGEYIYFIIGIFFFVSIVKFIITFFMNLISYVLRILL